MPSFCRFAILTCGYGLLGGKW